MADFEIIKGLEDLEPLFIGTPKQFFVSLGEVYCVRADCEGCPHFGDECNNDTREIQTDPIPHSRRAIGYEEEAFLILIFKEGQSFDTLPKELWDSPYANLCMYEANLHWLVSNPLSKFKTLKGQIRYYDTKEEFFKTDYAQYLNIFDEYTPIHLVGSMDYSSIEPKISTLVSREKLWIEIFKGKPKVVCKEISLSDK